MCHREEVDAHQVTVLRELLSQTGWVERADVFAGSMRRVTRRSDGLLLVGTPTYEPWHLAAHLTDEATLGGAEDLRPELVRWAVPLSAPPHLRIGIDRLEHVRRGEPLLVVSSDGPTESLLERVDSARRRGGTIFALGTLDAELTGLAHEALPVDSFAPKQLDLDLAEHLVSLSAATQTELRGWRGSLRHALDRLSGG